VPKDRTKNIDRYKIEGGHLNEFEFQKQQEELAEQRNQSLENLIPGTPPELRAERAAESEAVAREIASKAKKTRPAKKAKPTKKTPAKKARPPKKRPAAQTKAKSRSTKSTRAAAKKKPAKRTTKKMAQKSTKKKANKK
jgi:hypothetical protein